MNQQQATNLYRNFRSIPKDVWAKPEAFKDSRIDRSKIVEAIKGSGVPAAAAASMTKLSDEALTAQLVQSMRLLGRAAHECDEETFVDSLSSGQIPPTKLQKAEMESLKGGEIIVSAIAVGAAVVVGGLIGTAVDYYGARTGASWAW